MFMNKIRYLFLIVFVGLISILYNEYVMGIIFITVLILPMVLFALLSICYGMISAELYCPVHVVSKGERIPVSLQLNNPTIFPIYGLKVYLVYQNTCSVKWHKKELMVTIDGRSSLHVSCNIQSDYTGKLNISLRGIRCYDYLKLFSLKKKYEDTIKVAVLPNFYEIEDDFISNQSRQYVESEHYSQTKSGDDSSEVFSIREYREGDRLQRIHWKLSSKQNKLMIKEFSDPINCSVLIYLDLDNSNKKDILAFLDSLLECAMSVSYSLLIKSQYHYFAWFDKNLGICRRVRITTEKEFYEVVNGLLETFTCSNHSNTLTTFLAQYPTEKYTDLLYITGGIQDEKIDSLSLLPAADKRIILIHDGIEKITGKKDDYSKGITALGIDLSFVNIHNLQSDIQNLILSS